MLCAGGLREENIVGVARKHKNTFEVNWLKKFGWGCITAGRRGGDRFHMTEEDSISQLEAVSCRGRR